MSYSKTTWKTGDTITAQLLNHAEDGIAANDAAIAALPESLQLYGPYYIISNSDLTVAAGSTSSAFLDKPYDNNTYAALDFPEEAGICFLVGYSLGGTVLPFKVSAPAYNEGDSEWNGATVNVANTGTSQITLESGSLSVTFYSTAEFPTKQA